MNSKYFKIKKYKKLENKFFKVFKIFQIIDKQAYKFELSIKWKIYDLFYELLWEHDIYKKRQVNTVLLEPEKKFEVRNNNKYKIETIINNMI